MRILLDECVPRRLGRLLEGHEVSTVQDQGWHATDDGPLLGRAQADFDVFVTSDRRLRFQQNLALFEIGVVVLVAESNRLSAYVPVIDEIRAAVLAVRPREFIEVEA